MTDEELKLVKLQDNFYRDRYGKVILMIVNFFLLTLLIVGLIAFLHLDKPQPVVFSVDDDWRVKPPVPIDQPYLSETDILQWVTQTLSKVFVLDFVNYNDQLKEYSQFFTPNGWKIFLNQLNIYANYNNVQTSKLFITSEPAGAPTPINDGLLNGRYAWWVQMPITLNFVGVVPQPSKTLTLQILVVRVPTLISLIGLGIDNIIVAKSAINLS